MTDEATKTNATFPSLRGQMGDWVYYSTLMSFADVARWVTRTDQIHSNDRLREWIQRELNESRIEEISTYLTEQPQRFFNSIIVGIHEGSPEWYPVEVGDSKVLGSPNLDDTAKGAIGLLRLKGGEKVFAIDGQHRVEGIIAALKKKPDLAGEHLSVLFVAHSSSPDGRERTRRLFSTVNRNARPVSKGEIVALDEDDAFAVVTRRLVEDFEDLKGHRVAFRRQTPIKESEKSAITSILGLYDIVQVIYWKNVGATAASLREFTSRRPAESVISEIFEQQKTFWRALQKARPEIAEVLSARESEQAAAPYRREDGGNVLFRPHGQKAFARAVRVLMNRGKSLKKAVSVLSRVPLELTKPPWLDVMWDPRKDVMVTRDIILAQNVFLYSAGYRPEPAGYALQDRYRRLTERKLMRRKRTAKSAD